MIVLAIIINGLQLPSNGIWQLCTDHEGQRHDCIISFVNVRIIGV